MVCRIKSNEVIRLELLEEARSNDTGILFKNMFKVTPSWESVLNLLNKQIHKDYVRDPLKHEELLKLETLDSPFIEHERLVRFWDRLTLTVKTKNYDLSLDIPEINVITKEISKLEKRFRPDKIMKSSMVISFIENNGSVGEKHHDPCDQFQWQCNGKSKWLIGKNLQNEFIIEPGDFLFIPSYTNHKIESLSPRCAVTFQMNDLGTGHPWIIGPNVYNNNLTTKE